MTQLLEVIEALPPFGQFKPGGINQIAGEVPFERAGQEHPIRPTEADLWAAIAESQKPAIDCIR